MGFEGAGFEIAWTNECEPEFVKGYEFGTTFWRMSNGIKKPACISSTKRIENLDSDSILSEAFPEGKPEMFGVVGGPPCPDFSVGGKNLGFDGGRGKLSRVFVQRICDLSPDFFVFENVPGLIRTERHRKIFDQLLCKLREKYVCDWKVLNALDFGVPQDRQRLILIGVSPSIFRKHFGRKHKQNEADWFPWPKPKYPNAVERFNWTAISDSVTKSAKPKNIPSSLMVGTYLNGNNPPQSHPNGDETFIPRSEKFTEIEEGDISRKSFKRLHRWRYSPTAAYGNNEVHLHPWEDRRLSVREVLRIQSIPDTYILPKNMTLSAKFKMVANGVPVLLAEAIGKSVIRFLNRS